MWGLGFRILSEGKPVPITLLLFTVVFLLTTLFSGQQQPALPQRNSVAPPCFCQVLQTTRGQLWFPLHGPFPMTSWTSLPATLSLAHYSSPPAFLLFLNMLSYLLYLSCSYILYCCLFYSVFSDHPIEDSNLICFPIFMCSTCFTLVFCVCLFCSTDHSSPRL